MKNKSYSDWKEIRRLRAIELYCKGWAQSEIAEALGVTKGAVSQWIKKFNSNDLKSLESIPKSGAPPRLSIEQKYQMLEYLYPGAEAWGFQGEIWTCARIRKMIEQQFGVTYNRRYIARIMKELNWSSHKPKILSTQRDENEIQFWKNKTWSNLKKSDKREKDSISPR